jgi:hypothetical protein
MAQAPPGEKALIGSYHALRHQRRVANLLASQRIVVDVRCASCRAGIRLRQEPVLL